MIKSSAERIWFLDNVRYWTVLAVVVLHVAMSQTTIPWDWPVSDARQLVAADWLVVVTSSFVMPVLFFVAGYFALSSLAPRGPAKFLWSKFKRLVIPGALVVVFLNPIFRYIFHYSRGFGEGIAEMSYWQYWPRFFDGAFSIVVGRPADAISAEYSPLHLWFVTVLLLFSAVTAAAVVVAPKLASRPSEEKSGPPTTASLVMFLVVVTLMAWAASLAVAAFCKCDWVRFGPFLMFRAPNMPFHILYYCLGISAYRQRWFSLPGRLGNVWVWFPVCVGLSLVLCSLVARLVSNPELEGNGVFQAVLALCDAFLCMGFLGFLLTFGQRYFDRPSKFNRHMALNSYRTYLLHMTVVVLVQLALSRCSSLSAMTVLVAGVVLSLLGSHLVALLAGRVRSLLTLKVARQDPVDGKLSLSPKTG